MSSRTFLKELSATAAALGYVLVRRRRHLVWRHPCGAVVVTARSASDHRALENAQATMRRSLRTPSP